IEVVAEYEATVLNELDLMREASNAAQLRRNFKGSPLIYVPEVYWDYCRTQVMVMEHIHGVPINDMESLRRAGTNFRKLAANGVEIFFTQVFRDNFFHADMHPGNIFVDITDPKNPRYAAVDFGIVGTLDDTDRHYLAENFMAFFQRDYHRVAQLHVNSGWVPADTRVNELESGFRTVCEPIFNKPLKEISFGQVLLKLFQVAQRFDMKVQPQLFLLQKTLMQIEGLGRELYPDLDLWETGQPVLKKWMAQQTGPKATAERIRQELPEVRYVLEHLPGVARRLIDQVLAAESKSPIPDQQSLYRRERRQYRVIGGAAGIVAGALLIGLDANPKWVGWVVGVVSIIALYLGRPKPPLNRRDR
ncbi:MAG: AarF/UbiB family protein, partial [Gammaproteobacteria bacterium]|nr:AarF/UbiB family protein [Gammaproteobacteria bacterium]